MAVRLGAPSIWINPGSDNNERPSLTSPTTASLSDRVSLAKTAVCSAAPAGKSEARKNAMQTNQMLDPDTRTAKVRVLLDNPNGRFKPGMFATVFIKDIPKEQITIPTTAVVQVGKSAFVFEQTDPTTYLSRLVQLGQQHGERVVITNGLTRDAKVVVKNAVLLGQ
jgi:hypothetical protein